MDFTVFVALQLLIFKAILVAKKIHDNVLLKLIDIFLQIAELLLTKGTHLWGYGWPTSFTIFSGLTASVIQKNFDCEKIYDNVTPKLYDKKE